MKACLKQELYNDHLGAQNFLAPCKLEANESDTLNIEEHRNKLCNTQVKKRHASQLQEEMWPCFIYTSSWVMPTTAQGASMPARHT